MIISITIGFISFFLDGLFSTYREHLLFNTFNIMTLFVVSSLVLIHPFLKPNIKKYFKYAVVIGILYDVVYMNTLFLNAGLFVLLGYFINISYLYLSNNVINGFFINIATILLYKILFYLILSLVGYFDFEIYLLFKGTLSYIFINSFYFLLVYSLIVFVKNPGKTSSLTKY